MNNRVLCGIVTFNPDFEKLKININAIINQVDKILLVDNGSMQYERFDELKNEKVSMVRYKTNKGIASALNEIVRYSNEKNFKWIFFLDQDSISPIGIINQYLLSWNQCENCGMLTPDIKYKNGPVDSIREAITEKEWCITSGSFTKVDIVNRMKGFDEKMFIDLVDYDMCYQLKRAGFKIYQVNGVKFYHELGNLKYKKILNKTLWIENHNAFRKYYIVRNRLYLKRKYKLNGMPIYFDIFVEYAKVLLFERDKISKFKRMMQGLIDGSKMNINSV